MWKLTKDELPEIGRHVCYFVDSENFRYGYGHIGLDDENYDSEDREVLAWYDLPEFDVGHITLAAESKPQANYRWEYSGLPLGEDK